MARENLKKARKDAGMTQQEMANILKISLRQYQRMEDGTSTGPCELWDVLEDTLKIHQRILRECPDNHHDKEENQLEH